MPVTIDISLIAAIASLILSIIAIALSLYFYDRGKSTEKSVGVSLAKIEKHGEMLQKLTGKWMDRFTRHATSAKPADETTLVLIEAIRGLTGTGISSQLDASVSADNYERELVSSYIAIFYYCALANVISQHHLPDLEDLDTDNSIQILVDQSHDDYYHMGTILQNIDQAKVAASPLNHQYTIALGWKDNVKKSTTVYADRAAEVAGEGGEYDQL